jgi:hypothetical protein
MRRACVDGDGNPVVVMCSVGKLPWLNPDAERALAQLPVRHPMGQSSPR